MFVEKLEIKATSAVSNDDEIFVFLLTNEVESIFESGERVNMNLVIHTLMLDFTLIDLLDVIEIGLQVRTNKRVRSVWNIFRLE